MPRDFRILFRAAPCNKQRVHVTKFPTIKLRRALTRSRARARALYYAQPSDRRAQRGGQSRVYERLVKLERGNQNRERPKVFRGRFRRPDNSWRRVKLRVGRRARRREKRNATEVDAREVRPVTPLTANFPNVKRQRIVCQVG